MFKRQFKSTSLHLISLLFFYVAQANALPDVQLRSLTTQLEARQILSNIQELSLEGVTSKVSGGVITLYNLRALSDIARLDDYLEVDFLFDTESLRLIPVKLEKSENLGIYYRSSDLFSKDVSANIFLTTPSGDALPSDQLHRLTIQSGDEFTMDLEAGTVLAERLRDSSDDYYRVIEGPNGEIVSRSLYEANSAWTSWGKSILKSGRYIVRFMSQNDTNMSLDYSFTNNNRLPLETLVSGSSIEISLNGHGREYAKYKIKLNTGDLLEVSEPSDGDISLRLVNENSVQLKSVSGKLFYRVNKTGDYYLFIVNTDSHKGSDYSGTINITLDPNANLYPILSKINRQYANISSTMTLPLSATNTPESYVVAGLPDGLSVDETSGLISGIPKISGTFLIQATAQNQYGNDQQKFLLTVSDIQGNINISEDEGSSGALGVWFLFGGVILFYRRLLRSQPK